MRVPATLLCKNPSEDKEKRIEQSIMCAIIEGYTDATGELSRFINRLFKDKNPNASLIYAELKPLFEQQDENYNNLVEELNEI